MKLTEKHIVWMLLTAMVLLAGCGSDDAPTTVSENTPKEIRLNANVWRVMDGTRTTYYDNDEALETEGSFKCEAYNVNTTTSYFDATTVSWSDPSWALSPSRYWPLPATQGGAYPSLDFFAYAPATPPSYITGPSYTTARSPQFSCDLSSGAAKEFIWALTTGQNKDTNSGTVDMEFKHPFARISFEKNAASGDHVTINSITLSGNLYMTGTCTFDGTTSTWSSLGGAASLGSLSTGTPYLVIPYNYVSMTITVNATWNDWSNVTTNVTSDAVAINWQPGYSYTYSLTLSKTALIVNTSKFTEQW